MSFENNIKGDQAICKLKELVKNTRTCMMITDTQNTLNSCPMHTQKVDDDGNLWFFSTREGEHHNDILADNRIHLIYNNDSKGEYLSITGNAYITVLPEKIEELWSPFLEAWFDGKEDPKLCLYRVEPVSAHYWENKDGKITTFLKMIKSAITKEKTEIGIEGSLELA